MPRNFSLGICAILLIAVSGNTRAATLMLDGFATYQSLVSGGPTVVSSSSITGNDILGGERDLTLEMISGGSLATAASTRYQAGRFDYSTGANVLARCELVWDGTDANALQVDSTGLGGLNLLHGTGPLFTIEDFISDHGTRLVVRLFDAADATGQTWCEAIWQSMNASPTPSQITFAASDFSYVGPGGGANLSRIGAISLLIDGSQTRSLDIAMGGIYLVPEPCVTLTLSSTLLILSGFIVSASRRR